MRCCLGKGELIRLAGGGRVLALHCLKGTLWVTIGDGADNLLCEGGFFTLPAGASALVEALGLAEMRLEAASSDGATIRPIAAPPTLPGFPVATLA